MDGTGDKGQGKAPAADAAGKDDEPAAEAAPDACWAPARVDADIELSSSLVATLDAEKGVSVDILPAIQAAAAGWLMRLGAASASAWHRRAAGRGWTQSASGQR